MHQRSRRLTPHPAGLPFVVAALFVVLAAFLAAADPCPSTPSARAAVGSTPRALVTHVARAVMPATPAAGVQVGDVREAVSDSIHGADDGCAEHGETRRKVGGRPDKRLPSTAAATVLDAPLSFSLPRGAVAPTRRGRAAPPPVVPRAPPAR